MLATAVYIGTHAYPNLTVNPNLIKLRRAARTMVGGCSGLLREGEIGAQGGRGGQVPARFSARIYLIPILDFRADLPKTWRQSSSACPKFRNVTIFVSQ